jgi:hypothetical protein
MHAPALPAAQAHRRALGGRLSWWKSKEDLDMKSDRLAIHPLSAVVGGVAAVLILGLASFRGGSAQSFGAGDEINELKEFLEHFSVVLLDDGQGHKVKTFRLSGVNLQIVNGLGATNGNPDDPQTNDPLLTKTNGRGNLIVGYNELKVPVIPNSVSNDRTGSHNIVVGKRNDYTSYGGLVAGDFNESSGPFSSVSGGNANRAVGLYASISGGFGGRAAGSWAAISGGHAGKATGEYASVSGGRLNVAGGNYASVSGGAFRSAPGYDDWAAGGLFEDF